MPNISLGCQAWNSPPCISNILSYLKIVLLIELTGSSFIPGSWLINVAARFLSFKPSLKAIASCRACAGVVFRFGTERFLYLFVYHIQYKKVVYQCRRSLISKIASRGQSVEDILELVQCFIGFCLREMKMCLSNVPFLRVWKHSAQFCTSVFKSISRMLIFGHLTINMFRPVFSIDMYNWLTIFLVAGISFKIPVMAATLGFCWPTSRKGSDMETVSRSNAATLKSWTVPNRS